MEDWNMYVCNVQTFQGLLEELVSVLPESKHVTGKRAIGGSSEEKRRFTLSPPHWPLSLPPPQHRASGGKPPNCSLSLGRGRVEVPL